MQERCKRVFEKFPWVPPHQRLDRFGQPLPPRKPELRKPLYRLERDGSELFFVNDSDQVLATVSAECVATLALGEDQPGQVAVDGAEAARTYHDVQPGEAVKVDEFDPRLDSDFLIQTRIKVISVASGELVFYTPCERGGCAGDIVLSWREAV